MAISLRGVCQIFQHNLANQAENLYSRDCHQINFVQSWLTQLRATRARSRNSKWS